MALCFLAVVQPGAVDEMGVRHPQFRRPLVHLLHKSAFAARNQLCHGAGAVVGRRHGNGFEHIRHRHCFPRLEVNLASSLGGGGLRSRHLVIQVNPSVVQRLHNQQHGHHFRDAGRSQALVTLLFVKHRAGGHIHQQGAFCIQVQVHCRRPSGQHSRQQHRGQQQRCHFFH